MRRTRTAPHSLVHLGCVWREDGPQPLINHLVRQLLEVAVVVGLLAGDELPHEDAWPANGRAGRARGRSGKSAWRRVTRPGRREPAVDRFGLRMLRRAKCGLVERSARRCSVEYKHTTSGIGYVRCVSPDGCCWRQFLQLLLTECVNVGAAVHRFACTGSGKGWPQGAGQMGSDVAVQYQLSYRILLLSAT